MSAPTYTAMTAAVVYTLSIASSSSNFQGDSARVTYALAFEAASATVGTTVNPNYSGWYASDVTVLASSPYYFADGSYFKPSPPAYVQGSSLHLDVYDDLNGSLLLAWEPITYPADSYNVYVNGVLNQNVTGLSATVTGLQIASYNGVTTRPSLTYELKVVSVVDGVEVGATLGRRITASPTSVMLTTPMKRLWPFPNTGLD